MVKYLKLIDEALCFPLDFFRKGNQTIVTASMIHIGEKSYYETLQNVIDSVPFGFYEKVKIKEFEENPELADEKPEIKQGLEGMFKEQEIMKELLGLEHQKDNQTYPDNWINSDIDLAEIMRILPSESKDILPVIGERGDPTEIPKEQRDSFRTMIMYNMYWGMRNLDLGTKFPLYKIMKYFPEPYCHFKDFYEVIMLKRNQALFDDLEEHFLGTDRDMAMITYGTAHMPYIHRFLKKNGFESVNREWIKAWDAPNYDKSLAFVMAESLDILVKEVWKLSKKLWQTRKKSKDE